MKLAKALGAEEGGKGLLATPACPDTVTNLGLAVKDAPFWASPGS